MLIYLNMTILLIITVSFMSMSNLLISKKMFKNQEKMSPFECGFDPISKSRLPFSIQFYLITVIFLIFDIEIVMMIPMIKYISMKKLILWNLTSNTIIMILIIGILKEWKEGALKWFKYSLKKSISTWYYSLLK
uniref:NADH-ubiquinone oxidoreductase chain 3 n=2 Tax=Vanhornia eucnemidarum TaxID=32432 RepID=Q0H2F6_9HYME|nr:NADH dehydrogenase subunit 3 [Vanhornia eucnemidarum]